MAEDILKEISELDSSKAIQATDIPVKVIKDSSNFFAEQISAYSMNLSLRKKCHIYWRKSSWKTSFFVHCLWEFIKATLSILWQYLIKVSVQFLKRVWHEKLLINDAWGFKRSRWQKQSTWSIANRSVKTIRLPFSWFVNVKSSSFNLLQEYISNR